MHVVCLTVSDRLNTQLESHEAGRVFAVVHFAGKQRKVTAEDIIIADKHLEADVGQRICLNKVTHRQYEYSCAPHSMHTAVNAARCLWQVMFEMTSYVHD